MALNNAAGGEGDYSLGPVPAARRRHWFIVFAVVVGHVIGVPIFVVGAQIGFGLGLGRAVLANFAGGALLSVVGIATSYIGARRGVSTYVIVTQAFGPIGAKFVNLIFAVTFIGWFGVQVNLFSLAVNETASAALGLHAPLLAYGIVGGILMITTTVYGFAAIQLLSLWCVPVLFAALVFTAYRASAYAGTGGEVVTLNLRFGDGVAMVAGGYMLGAVVMPDFTRFCRSGTDSVVVAVTSLGIALPVVMCLAAIPTVIVGDHNLIHLMMRIGLGIPAMLVVLLATWSINSAGLYCNSLGLATVFERIPRTWLAIGAGCLGMVAALFNVTRFLPPFLTLLSIALPPVAGILVAYHFLEQSGRAERRSGIALAALSSWIAAFTVSGCTMRGWLTLSGLPAADSLIVATCLYVAISLLQHGARTAVPRHP